MWVISCKSQTVNSVSWGVSGTHMAGFLAYKHVSQSLFLSVLTETVTFVAIAKSLLRVNAESNLLGLAMTTLERSFFEDVAFNRPLPGRLTADPVSTYLACNRRMTILLTLWARATLRCSCPGVGVDG